jgi:hypothetical protein
MHASHQTRTCDATRTPSGRRNAPGSHPNARTKPVEKPPQQPHNRLARRHPKQNQAFSRAHHDSLGPLSPAAHDAARTAPHREQQQQRSTRAQHTRQHDIIAGRRWHAPRTQQPASQRPRACRSDAHRCASMMSMLVCTRLGKWSWCASRGRRDGEGEAREARLRSDKAERASERVSGLLACLSDRSIRHADGARTTRCDATRYGRREISKHADKASEARVRG